MNAKLIVVLIILVAIGGFFYISNQQTQDPIIPMEKGSSMEVQKTQIPQEVKTIQKEVKQEVQTQVEKTQSLIQQLIAKAKELLQKGDYEGAIATAKQALAKDPNSAEAKSIIERAKEALQKLAEEKLGDAKAQAEEKMGDLKGALGSFGQ